MPIRFINADLELTSELPLHDIIESFGDAIVILGRQNLDGRHFATCEISEEHPTPEAAVAAFCQQVGELPAQVSESWRQCVRRVIDLGFEREGGDEVSR